MRKLTFEQFSSLSEQQLQDWRAGTDPVEDTIASIISSTYTAGRSELEFHERQWATGRA